MATRIPIKPSNNLPHFYLQFDYKTTSTQFDSSLHTQKYPVCISFGSNLNTFLLININKISSFYSFL